MTDALLTGRRYDVVIPAGGGIDAAFAQAIGSPFRALAPLGPERTPVLQHVIDALRATGSVGRLVCAAPKPLWGRIAGVDEWLEAEDSGPANILNGLRAVGADAPALVCASDLPLMTSDGVSAFVRQIGPDAAVAVGVVRAGDYNAAYPDAPPSTFVPLRDIGPVTLAGLFLVRPDVVLRQRALLDALFGARKSQARMARALGPRLLLGWATRTLTLAALTARAEAILGAPVQAVDRAAPALAYDMDTAQDYADAKARYGK